ncbi:hypothetical protein ATCVMO0605SPH_560L [Acanthocystis turfacea Chlorella virus MO0605SPH]|uniref:Uncharacterized protein Z488L n=1 Tax=Chlorovirus heliozoae TaxID=322019 RepID=A7K998_9PHYC|nr:hypothetical protein ATCV1_Z488L [Acanthocystis turfacea chlorella virus 1]ABT16622.1 hypothetical protein ATCV1_Z488L [Acanthocystis turfacea chlorella virus 1]AGE56023.1 hypothetical protein ATCVMO0605SPH_560L [Acanthocystis turfacea Chlorella virus MO0605SPH]AGE57020.1 hypothetical protein ATCVNEJV3_575L [Acanthocystis turfacea Chlorella virus NE-JV-3]AGE60144.1 hypothetical protein ATCVWI0606_585L [Acanthocystis turfacea Chlorella virus WI0606]
MYMSSLETLELSPGFFDPRIAMSDEEEEPIVPMFVDIENSKKNDIVFNDENTNVNDEKNFVEDVVVFMFTVQKSDCGCTGWKRTSTY